MKKMISSLILLLSFSIKADEAVLKRVAIIGGGMSGVATSAFLRDKKFEIHLFEKEAKLGGHVRTFPLPGLDGKLVNVDIGPQYVNPVGWAIYVDFLKYFGLWDLKNFWKFKQSMTIFNEDAKMPSFITPGAEGESGYKWFKEVDSPVKRVTSLLKFMSKAHKHQQIEGEKPYISVQHFLDQIKITKKFQNDIIKPVIATGFTAPLDRVGELSVTTVAGVLAFQSPLIPAYWYVSKFGIQPYIEQIAQKIKIQNPHFQIHLSTPVTKVSKNENGTYKVFYGDDESMDVDYVVFSTHVPVLAEILKDYKAFDGIWDSMPYTYNKVVIHTDREVFMDSRFPAFYNVKVRKDKTVGMAMNLGMISKDFGPLLKSWGLTDSEYQRMKKEGKIVAESDFMHPLQTISFLKGLRKLKAIGKKEGNIFFTGGWSMDFETQFNAVLSGYYAASAITPNLRYYWQSMMPSLSKK
jgi:predicted NAD/FAD-binding protein